MDDHDIKIELIRTHIESFGTTASDAFISIFSSAAKSFQADSLLTPYPASKYWLKEDGTKNFEKVIAALDKFPSVDDFLVLLYANTTTIPSVVPAYSVELISQLVSTAKYTIETVPSSNHPDVFALIESSGKLSSKPNFIFKINYNNDSNRIELKFKEHANIMGTKFAFHGTKFSKLHSILNHGLQQHLNKNSLYGEGIYLSTELDISLHFSPAALNWENSALGRTISCIAICEYVNDPNHVKMRKENAKNSDIPHSYILVTNNEVVRVRYLLIYGKKRTLKPISKPESESEVTLDTSNQSRIFRCMKWCRKNPFIVSVLLYMTLLLLIGVSNNRMVDYYRNNLMNFVKKRLKFV